MHEIRRRSLRYAPLVDPSEGGPGRLGCRVLPSGVASIPVVPHHPGHVHALAARAEAKHAASRVTPAQEVNKQYDLFESNFQTVLSSYVESLDEQSTGTVGVSTTLTANYSAGTASMEVADASVFGPEGVYASPVIATAYIGSVPVAKFTLTGSSGNLVTIGSATPNTVSLNSGTTLSAQVASSASSSASTIFPSYITSSSQQLAGNLVAYFDSLPFKLPRMYATPHQPQRGGAIQQYVYQVVAGSPSTSLMNTLEAIALPQTPGSDLQIYNDTVDVAIESSRSQMLSTVRQIFAGKYPVVPINASSGSSSTSGTGTTSGSSTNSTATPSSTSVA